MSEVRGNGEETSSTARGRKEWVKPDIKIMSAGSAELAVGAIDDGVDES
jgi:hypothetical protein